MSVGCTRTKTITSTTTATPTPTPSTTGASTTSATPARPRPRFSEKDEGSTFDLPPVWKSVPQLTSAGIEEKSATDTVKTNIPHLSPSKITSTPEQLLNNTSSTSAAVDISVTSLNNELKTSIGGETFRCTLATTIPEDERKTSIDRVLALLPGLGVGEGAGLFSEMDPDILMKALNQHGDWVPRNFKVC